MTFDKMLLIAAMQSVEIKPIMLRAVMLGVTIKPIMLSVTIKTIILSATRLSYVMLSNILLIKLYRMPQLSQYTECRYAACHK